MNPFDKIKALLQSDDLMNVNMGLELLDTLATEPEELSQALGIDANISSVDYLKAALKGFEHQGTILVWDIPESLILSRCTGHEVRILSAVQMKLCRTL